MHFLPSVRTADRSRNGQGSRPGGDLSPLPAPAAGDPRTPGTPAAPAGAAQPAPAAGTAPGAAPRTPAHHRRPHRAGRPQLPALAALGGAALLLAAAETALLFDQPGAIWVLILFPAAALTWLAAGTVALLRRPGNRMGAIMLAGGLVWFAAGLLNAPQPALASAGAIVSVLPLALGAHLLHAFPSGRLRGRTSRTILAGIYVAALVLHAPVWLFLPGEHGSPLQAADRPDLAQLGLDVQDVVGGGLMLATALLLAHRMRSATRAQRRVLAPLALYGIAAVALVPVMSRLQGPLLGDDPIALFAIQATLLGLLPVAFVAAVLRGGFAPTAGVRELSAWLGAGGSEPAPLREALADALGDPSVELALWAGERERWVDGDGRPARLPDPRSGRGAVLVEAEGRTVGAIVYDMTLIADAAPVREAAGVIALALDRDRLTAELIAGRERLRESRARISAAADDERRRIARDLHDGVQGRLVVLGLRAGELRRRADADGDDAARAEADALRVELDATLHALRELVRGVLPAALGERGLGAAAEELADRMPLPTTVDAGDERWPAPVESACWFVVSEALANVVKHAGATRAHVHVTATAAGVRVEVRDDGRGGAATGPLGRAAPTNDLGAAPTDELARDSLAPAAAARADGPPSSGTGLRGLADRLDVLNGTLTVDSPPGGGTRIVAEVPCGS
jgi:signal transduction histidine kinase